MAFLCNIKRGDIFSNPQDQLTVTIIFLSLARASPETNYKVAIIIMGCLLGAVTFLALFVFGLYCRIRKKPQTSRGSSAEMKQGKGLLKEKA